MSVMQGLFTQLLLITLHTGSWFIAGLVWSSLLLLWVFTVNKEHVVLKSGWYISLSFLFEKTITLSFKMTYGIYWCRNKPVSENNNYSSYFFYLLFVPLVFVPLFFFKHCKILHFPSYHLRPFFPKLNKFLHWKCTVIHKSKHFVKDTFNVIF